MFGSLCLLFCSLYYVSACKEGPFFQDYGGPIVKTLSGSILGQNIKVLDTVVAAFFGIPFAIPPLGERRFMKPEPVKAWDDVLVAYKKPQPCMQYTSKNITIDTISDSLRHGAPSEDCLYLNVWSPAKCCCDEAQKFPVLVWIYGGGFSSGSTDVPLYESSTLASLGEAVVVTFNYRVGSFGYFYGGSVEAPGNAGMHDQILAMKWVKDNILFFGGDPDSITLFGQSAGAMSISMHMVSPLSRGLFHRAILQSGSSYGLPIADDPSKASLKARAFSVLTGCESESNFSHAINCLKSKEAMDLAMAEDTLTSKFPTLFTPIFNDEFLPKSPKEAYNSGDAAPVEVMAGFMKNEASIFLQYIMPEMFPYDSEPHMNLKVAWSVVQNLYKEIPLLILEILWETYFHGISNDDSPAIVNAIRESYGDLLFNCPTLFLMEKLDSGYLYWNTHRSLKNTLPEWVGATHFDDVPYVFGRPMDDTEHFTPEDEGFSRDLIKKWMTFARTGHPLGENKDLWPKFNSSNPIIYELNPRDYKILPFPKKLSCEFWRALLFLIP